MIERIWEELERRLEAPGFRPGTGPILEKGITAMRGRWISFMGQAEGLEGYSQD